MALVAKLSNSKLVAPVVLAILILNLIHIQSASCQVSEDDGQFEAIHQDIGRISGLQSASQVAPQTTIVNKQQHHRQQHQQDQQYDQAPQVVAPPPQQPRARVQPVLKKANRITLVPRRDQYTPLDEPAAPAQPQLLQPTQPQAASALVPAQLPAPTFESIAPATTQPQPQQFYQQPAPAPAAAPVLSSSRGSISARHSALVAQVAAERAAVGGLDTPPTVATLGSPIEALSSPVAQVHAPQRQQHHHLGGHPHAAAATAPVFQHQPAVPSLAQPQPAPAGISSAFVLDSPQDVQVPAPSFEQVLNSGCPPRGVFSYENRDFCDRYYMCTNGTFTEEACPNGLAYSQQGAVYQHCAYNWNVDCGRKKGPEPISSPGCPWQFGIFPIAANGQCSIDYFVCEWGVPETKRCSPEGLFYDERIKGCQWADQLGCKSEALLNFKCPAEDEENPYWPYPRYYHNQQDVIVCVNEQPRLVHCNEEQLVDPASLACVDVKKKKKF